MEILNESRKKNKLPEWVIGRYGNDFEVLSFIIERWAETRNLPEEKYLNEMSA
jgi:hypothetical protein